MPSKTFLNLKKEKRKKLIDAAIKEFSSVELEKVSINKIISDAKIPRGSFYMYFDGKYDLFNYVILLYRDSLLNMMKKSFLNNNGDFRKSFINLYDEIYKNINKYNIKRLFKNCFRFLEQQNVFFEKPGHDIFIEIENLINRELIGNNDLEFVFSLLMHNLITSFTIDCKNSNGDNRDMYIKKLDILCYGIYEKR